jgi:RimJ/RimL family protein N-acetyltransferase
VSAPSRITTERLVLRPYEAEDLPALREAVNASLDGIRPWMPNASRELGGDLEEWLRVAAELFDRGERYPFAICLHDGMFVGHVSADVSDDGEVVVGYWAHAGHLRRGYVSEAVRGLLAAGLGKRFVINCSPENGASMGVARACGFTQAGTRTLQHEGRDLEEIRWELVLD